MRKPVLALMVVAAVAAPGGARAQQSVDTFLQPSSKGPPESGISVALSVGYAVPMGEAVGGDAMSNTVSGAIPLQIDLGWRFSPYWYLGAFFQYSFGLTSSALSGQCSANGVSCGVSDLQFGVDATYTFLPYGGVLPYVGLGLGWEIFSVNVSGNGSGSLTLSGFQFARILAGVDFRVASAFRVGPFVNFSLGQYSSASSPVQNLTIDVTSLHEWLQFGVKGTFDL